MSLKEQIEKFVPYDEQEQCDKEMMLEYINTFDDVLTRNNKMCHFTASNWIINKERTKVLMIHHNIYNSWTWPGGHADGDEDLLRVALKEAHEETGLKNLKVLDDEIYSLEVFGVDGHVKKGKYVSAHLHLDCCFLIEADEEENLTINEDENSGVKWVKIEEASILTSEEKMRPIFRKINKKMKEMNK